MSVFEPFTLASFFPLLLVVIKLPLCSDEKMVTGSICFANATAFAMWLI